MYIYIYIYIYEGKQRGQGNFFVASFTCLTLFQRWRTGEGRAAAKMHTHTNRNTCTQKQMDLRPPRFRGSRVRFGEVWGFRTFGPVRGFKLKVEV